MQASLKNKVALVVGAADEVGQAIARRLADLGATVVEASPGDAANAKACVDQIKTRHGGLHILVNNTPDPAGHGSSGVGAEGLLAAVAATVGTQFAFIHEALPLMRAQGRGSIVNLSGIGYLGLPGGVDTAAAQAAVFGMTRSIALEAAPDRVTINTLVKGEMVRSGEAEETAAGRANGVPAKRLGTVADIAHAAAFFASDAAKYVTGQTLFVCGGKSVHFSMSV